MFEKELFFFLLKKGLGFQSNKTINSHLTNKEWQVIWSMAKKQTVCGFVFAGIEKLPLEMQPPKELMIQFWAYTERIKKENLKMFSVADEIVGWFEAEGLEPIVIKGITVGALYPSPELRMPGDIDLFFPIGYEKAIPIVKSKGLDVTLNSNHDVFSYKGITIELHHTAFRTLKPIENQDFSPIVLENNNYTGRVLNVKANAMLLLLHPAKHFMNEGIGLRQLCDWAMFLKRYEDFPEVEEAWNEIKRQGAERFAIEFTAIAVHYLGLKLRSPEKWIGNSKPEMKEKMLHLIMTRGNFAKSIKMKRSANAFVYFTSLGKYILSAYPYWKEFFWLYTPKRIGYRLLCLLKGNPLATK